MDSHVFIGWKKFFARACAHAFEKQHERIVFAIVFAVSLFSALSFADQASEFIFDHSQENSTRHAMGIADTCARMNSQALANALIASEGATIDPRISSPRGVVVLEGLISGAEPKMLDTVFLSPYKNYPTSIQSEITTFPAVRYPLAVTLAAKITGEGGLVLRKTDRLIIHADGQLFVYFLADLMIPSNGLLRLYVGTDDHLYYDSTLKHPLHSGACGGANGR